MRRYAWKITAFLVIALMLTACTSPIEKAVPINPQQATPAVTTVAPSTANTPTTAPAVTTKPAAPTAVPAVKIKRGGFIKNPTNADWETGDMHLDVWTQPDKSAHHESLLDTAMNPDTKKFEIVPLLGASWERPDPTTIIFKLQKNVKFHDGSAFNASIAKWNIERVMNHPKSVGKAYVSAIKSVEAIDDLTLKVNLKNPSASALWMLTTSASAHALMQSKEAVDKNGEEYLVSHLVGTGPFELTEWRKGDRQVFKKFNNYWKMGADGQPLPYLDGLEVRWIPDSSVQVLEMKAGNAQILTGIQPKDIPGLKSSTDYDVQELEWSGSVRMLGLNPAGGPFKDNLKLRQAAQYAIDSEALAKALGQGFGTAPKYIISPSQIGYSEKIPRYEYDLVKAKQLVKDAGYPDGVNTGLTVISRQPDLPQSEAIKSMLDIAGIKTTLDVVERVAWNQKLMANNFDSTTYSIGILVDPYMTMNDRFSSNGPGNHIIVKNPAVDTCLAEAEASVVEEKRGEVLGKCYGLVYDSAYYVHLWFLSSYNAYSKKLHGWKPYNTIFNFWSELWME